MRAHPAFFHSPEARVDAPPHPSMVQPLMWHKKNIGAGPSRNRALDESSADWVLFLDDDVKPSKSLLHVYGKIALKEQLAVEQPDEEVKRVKDDLQSNDKPKTDKFICGFVGKTEFPPVTTSLQRAVIMSDITYMYGVCEVVKRPAWGVTANLLVKIAAAPGAGWGGRVNSRFGHQFPNTGGGEDVDFCLR